MRFVKNRDKEKDKFYTPIETSIKCISKINLSNYDLIIEPSAGNGSFTNNINHNNLISLDLYPENNNIIKQDWLKYKIPTKYKNVLIIGNPPFGISNKLSKQFITHALGFYNVKTIGFILPNVYKKHTNQKILNKYWRIKDIIEIENTFIKDKKNIKIPCSFFIFDKSQGKDLRFKPEKYKNIKDFEFSNKDDFDIFVFGSSPKKIIKNPKPNNRGYYIKSKIGLDNLINNLKNINWEGNSCANGGVYWLTKPEFCYNYIKKYG